MDVKENNMIKESIAVYNPSDPVESAVQDACHELTGEWLGSYQCKQISKAISFLKCFDNWLDNQNLLNYRIKYFFSPHMCNNKSVMTFLTHPVNMRDIFENSVISHYLHGPITFITPPLAHYLFQEYPIHIYVSSDILKEQNKNVAWTDQGGLLIADKDVFIDSKSILKIKTKSQYFSDIVYSIIKDIDTPITKAAVSLVSTGVFTFDDATKLLFPDTPVWDKINRKSASIIKVEQGEEGTVLIRYNDGSEISIPKMNFDQQFVKLN